MAYDDEILAIDDDDMVQEMIEKYMAEEAPTPHAQVQPRIEKKGRGRPRKHFTKKVAMIEMEASGWLIRASRGRPKKGEVRVEVEVPFGLEIASNRFYTCENGVLTETWNSNEQR